MINKIIMILVCGLFSTITLAGSGGAIDAKTQSSASTEGSKGGGGVDGQDAESKHNPVTN